MIAANRLQTAFDKNDPILTLKQFMALAFIRQSPEPLSLTQLGRLLGCSRQNAKKLAEPLVRQGLAALVRDPGDPRVCRVLARPALEQYFDGAAPLHSRMLGLLFSEYSDEEMAQLLSLMTKLHQGVARVERATSEQEEHHA